MRKVAIVTGGSSGIGKLVAKFLSESYFTVYDFSRSGSSSEEVNHIFCDVSDEGSVVSAVNRVIELSGRIDLVINNAGMGISGAVEYSNSSDVLKQFDVNFFGSYYICKSCIPFLRENRGRIINICSVASDIPIPFQAFYSASKAAVFSISSALANELKPFGISVTSVLPGDVKTGFSSNRIKDSKGNTLYDGRIEKSVSLMEKDEQSGMSAEYVASKILRIALKNRVKPKYIIGFKYKIFSLLFKLLPLSISNRIIGLIYAK
jgi:short-subunit dehydrogenase